MKLTRRHDGIMMGGIPRCWVSRLYEKRNKMIGGSATRMVGQEEKADCVLHRP